MKMKPNAHRQLSFYEYSVPTYRKGICMQITHIPSRISYTTNYPHELLSKSHTRSKLKRCVDMHDLPLKFAVNRNYDEYEDDYNDITADNAIRNIIKLSINKHERTRRSYIMTIIQMMIRMLIL